MKFIGQLALLALCCLSVHCASITTTPEPDEGTTIEPESTTMQAEERQGTPEIPQEHPLPAFEKVTITIIEVETANATKYPGFSRDCNFTSDCQYQNPIVKSTAYLNCANKVCICENNRFIADVSIWKLEWTGSSCNIAVGGPCGTDASKDGNLTIGCQAGLDCVEGRCRDPSKLHSTPLNNSCNEDIDCQTGLVCKVTAFYFSASRTCVSPETPALKGFEEATTTASTDAGSTTTPAATAGDEKPKEEKQTSE